MAERRKEAKASVVSPGASRKASSKAPAATPKRPAAQPPPTKPAKPASQPPSEPAPERRTPGRKKGTPNKLTSSLREMIKNALEKLGGEDYLVRVGRREPRAFCTLLGKALPIKVDGGFNGTITVYTGVPREPQEGVSDGDGD